MKKLSVLIAIAVVLLVSRPCGAILKPILTTQAACANETFPSTGTIHYACDCQAGASVNCVAGNNAASGTSTSTPWQTYAKLFSVVNSIAAGDTLAFCKGGSFSVTSNIQIANLNSTAGNPIKIREYVPPWAVGGENKPIITQSNDSYCFDFENGGSAVHDEGYRVLNLDCEGAGSNSAFGVYFFNDVSDVYMCNMTFNAWHVNMYVAGANAPTGGSNDKNYNITLTGINSTNGQEQGYLGSCNNCLVNYNYFNQNGGDTIFDHGIYVGGADTSSGPYTTTGEQVIGNEVDNSEHVASTCQGNDIVMHGQHDGTLIENNLVQENSANTTGSCYGISVTNGYGTLEFFTNVVISGNTIVNPGQNGIYESICQNCTISNNLILAGVSSTGTTGIFWGDGSHTGDPDGTAATIVNNTFYESIGSRAATGIIVGVEGTGHVIANNSVYYASTGAFSCYSFPLSVASYAFINNNNCYGPSASSVTWEDSRGDSLAAWRTLSGFDTASTQANPKFIHPALSSFPSASVYNYYPQITSPLVNAGSHAHASSTDITGVTRRNPPTVGAYEYFPYFMASRQVHGDESVNGYRPPPVLHWWQRLLYWLRGSLQWPRFWRWLCSLLSR